ncbi:MAG TPA: DUF3857 domain-containing protein, partial [Bacteroidia bacterium]|nr:DUF3857 domain-containing protein [Bacteroidia bacterium]
MRKLNFILTICFGLASAVSLFAQRKDITDELAKKYPEENAVYLSRKEYNTIKLEKGQLKVYTQSHEDLLLLSDKVTSYSDRPIYFSSFSVISDIKAQSLVPDNNGSYAVVPVKEKYTTNDFSEGSFYDDMKATHLIYTGLTRGSRIQLDYTEKLNEARFFGRFFFSTSIPTEEAEFSIEVPKGVTIDWKYFNINQEDLEFTQQNLKKKTIYTWKKKNCAKYKTETDAPNQLYFAPHIVVFIKEYTVKKKTIKLLDSPGGLYDWYYSMVKDVNLKPDPDLQKVVDSLTNGITDEKEKVKKIFYWVQDNVKYVAFEDGLGGFVPREAPVICSRRYGDCKDMASITTTMLHQAGISTAYLTWIGARGIPYRYTDVPSPLCDNHMICTYISDGKYYFLDATGKNAPFGTPTSFIQGKQALIGEGPGKFEIVTVPVMSFDDNVRRDSVIMNMNPDFSIKGTGNMLVAGYEKIHLTYPLDGMSDKDRKTFFKKFLQKGSNKFVIDSLNYKNLYDRNANLLVNYDFSLGDYAHSNGSELYVNMQLDKSYMNEVLDSTERSAPKEIDFESGETDITILNIPDGYQVKCLPDEQTYISKSRDFVFYISYK